MSLAKTSRAFRWARAGMVSVAMVQLAVGQPPSSSGSAPGHKDGETATPIKHVIVIIGENRSFDHVFATYTPKRGQTVWNLLSKGIVKADGTPGPNFTLAMQRAASDQAPGSFLLSPPKTSFPGGVLPAPLAGGPKDSWIPGDSLTLAQQSENGLPANYYQYLISGGTGLASHTPDTRITNVNSLPPGPFQLTNHGQLTYNSYAASPVHRFYQMWQQEDCNAAYATDRNPSGCQADLFPWVEVTIGAGSNGQASGSPKYDAPSGEGATSMGFYNMAEGDVPYFKYLADHYAFSDNYHQAVMGGTGANHIMMGTGYAIPFTDGHGVFVNLIWPTLILSFGPP